MDPLEDGIGNAVALRDKARELGLDLGAASRLSDDDLVAGYNGIGPDRWDPERRRRLSSRYREFLPAVVVHDADFSVGGDDRALAAANARLRENLRKIVMTFPNPRRSLYLAQLPYAMKMVDRFSRPGWDDVNRRLAEFARKKEEERRGDAKKSASASALRRMGKSGGALKDEFDFVSKGIKDNPITKGEALRGAGYGALATALIGAGIGAITRKKNRKNRLRKMILGALIGAVPGAVLGPAVAQYRKYMDGVPFVNPDLPDIGSSGKAYIGVAGSANGENESWFADEMRARFPGKAYMLRHVDGAALEDLYRQLTGRGMDVSVVGHSSGGKAAARFLRKHPEASGYLIDPVSWFGKVVPGNAVVFTSDESTRHGGPFENNIADMGGRWNYEGPNSVVFKGSHSNMINALLRDFVAKGVRPGDKVSRPPSYVTAIFGKKTGG